MTLSRLLISFTLTSLLCFRLSAQNSGEQGPPPVQVRLLFLDESRGEGYSVKLEEGFQKVSSYPYAISNAVLQPPGAELEVYKNLPIPPPDPARNPDDPAPLPPRVKIATVHVPDSTSAVLAVIRPGSQPAKTQVDLYNSDPEKFPPNTIRVINLGNANMGISINGQVEQIARGNSIVFKPTPDPKNRVIARLAQQGVDEWKVIYDSVLILPPGKRITGVVVFSPSGMRHTYTQLEIEEFGAPQPRHQWLSYTETP